jgi:hypothetical protein
MDQAFRLSAASLMIAAGLMAAAWRAIFPAWILE